MNDLVLYVSVFVGLAIVFWAAERSFRRVPRRHLRPNIVTDLLHALISNAAAAAIFEAAAGATLAALFPHLSLQAMTEQSLWLQVALLLAITEVTFYWVHRAMHASPMLWRVHRVHHTPDATQMDWLAGYRKHPLETIAHSAAAFLPVAIIGFSPVAWMTFGLIGLLATGFTHLNTDAPMALLDELVVTPRYHAWHHSADARDQRHNLAGKLPLLDRLFGTRHGDGAAAWPPRLGLDTIDAHDGFIAHQVSPFRRSP